MALTLITAPDLFALTKGGRMLYQFSGSGRYESTGAKAVNYVLISPAHPVPDGAKLPLKFNNKTVTMTARTAPSQPGEFPAGDGSPAYVASILKYFKGYFPIRESFTVDHIPGPPFSMLSFSAKKAGAAYTIAPFSGLDSFTYGLPGPAGGDPLIRERYGVYVEVYLQKPGTDGEEESDFELVGAGQHIEADDDGLMQFDVGDLLHGYLSADVPDFGSPAGQLCGNSHRKYFIAYGEAWGTGGGPIKPQLIENDQIRHAYLGGADFVHRADGGFSLTTFMQGASSAEDRALRFGPSTRKVYIDEPAWLTFINVHPDVASVTLSIDLTFSDNSKAAATGIQQAVSYPEGAKVCYPVGVTQRDLVAQVPAGKFLQEYSVTLRGGGVDLSRSYRFVVDYDQRPYRRYFAYQNSLGAFDCISTWGKGSAELQRFYDQAERSIPAFYSPTDAQYVDYNVARQQSFEVASGWQLQSELVRWDDFYCASVRFQLNGSSVLAIGLTSKSIKQQKDGDTQFAHSFTYVYLHKDEYYTEEVSPGESLPPVTVPVGSVTIQPVVPVLTKDPTIDDSVRELTRADVNKIKIAALRPNPETLGFLTQQAGSVLFRRHDLPISYKELTFKPTSRDEAGLADVPTVTETTHSINQIIKKTVGIKSRLRSWTGDAAPL